MSNSILFSEVKNEEDWWDFNCTLQSLVRRALNSTFYNVPGDKEMI